MFIHRILSLNMNFTFKRVEGKIEQWELAGVFQPTQETSLYCGKMREAFFQLFTEFVDGIYMLTGEHFNLAPFYPDANCRVIILDGEVPQAQSLTDFLAKCNDLQISGIDTRDQGGVDSRKFQAPQFWDNSSPCNTEMKSEALRIHAC
ncbi:hypothetical protein C8R43DRAFT_942552 [Mycena crocata]|nr:hypothetical protein C8R43DRAFT_942552 [Mycena crocata]